MRPCRASSATEHAGRPPSFWSLFTAPSHRRERLQETWHAVWKIFLLAVAMDVVYQLLVLEGLRPIQGLLVAMLLALVPYVLLRGPVSRIARALLHHP